MVLEGVCEILYQSGDCWKLIRIFQLGEEVGGARKKERRRRNKGGNGQSTTGTRRLVTVTSRLVMRPAVFFRLCVLRILRGNFVIPLVILDLHRLFGLWFDLTVDG